MLLVLLYKKHLDNIIKKMLLITTMTLKYFHVRILLMDSLDLKNSTRGHK